MLDPKLIQDDMTTVEKAVDLKAAKVDMGEIKKWAQKVRDLTKMTEEVQREQNLKARQMAELRKTDPDKFSVLKKDQRIARDKQKKLEEDLKKAVEQFDLIWQWVPNLPLNDVPVGDESKNNELSRWGNPRAASGARSHDEIGRQWNLYDPDAGVRLAGSRFSVLRNEGALLERALIWWMLEKHVSLGYQEISPPYLATEESLFGSAQLPKMKDDMFFCEETKHYLIPTAEVPLMNLHRGEILPEAELPMWYVAHTPSFRKEAGSYGKDVKGLIRQHQFHKIELFALTRPEDSEEALEKIRKDAEAILRALELPYRVVELATQDLTFASAKTYDLEVWMPGQGAYREISSCSTCTDFQARRTQTRYRPNSGGRPRLVHSLNGSALAIGRTWAAILENFETEDGRVRVPEVLRPYMGGKEVIPQPNRDR